MLVAAAFHERYRFSVPRNFKRHTLTDYFHHTTPIDDNIVV